MTNNSKNKTISNILTPVTLINQDPETREVLDTLHWCVKNGSVYAFTTRPGADVANTEVRINNITFNMFMDQILDMVYSDIDVVKLKVYEGGYIGVYRHDSGVLVLYLKTSLTEDTFNLTTIDTIATSHEVTAPCIALDKHRLSNAYTIAYIDRLRTLVDNAYLMS